MLRRATVREVKRWDEFLAENPAGGEVFQTKAFATIKQNQGWQPEFWVYETSYGKVYTLTLTRQIIGVGRIIYIPRGPGVTNVKQWREICRLNRSFERAAVLIKMDPPIVRASVKTLPSDLTKVGNVQRSTVNTVTINLDQSEDDLWRSFRQRARRSIRGGKKEQLRMIDVKPSPDSARQMWRLYKGTAKRARLSTRRQSYYQRFWQEFGSAGMGRFFFVLPPNESKPIAGAFVSWSGQNALYKDGGSRRNTNTHFSHLLHWQIMHWLGERGITSYDLGGTPPSDQLNDPTHVLASLATFKLSFGAPVTDFIGTYDQVLKPADYKRWRRIERLWRGIARRTSSRDIY
ncbi:MAG: peptidoglycan bridge formation glycyltransferase FemA/FemB family protein [Candidatus Nomurabacteria bacterium]|nr:peptidoglycan bridge formation glycyltransferase FemA/FemB family protein [Candidatus Nomurabacteria bacterium]